MTHPSVDYTDLGAPTFDPDASTLDRYWQQLQAWYGEELPDDDDGRVREARYQALPALLAQAALDFAGEELGMGSYSMQVAGLSLLLKLTNCHSSLLVLVGDRLLEPALADQLHADVAGWVAETRLLLGPQAAAKLDGPETLTLEVRAHLETIIAEATAATLEGRRG